MFGTQLIDHDGGLLADYSVEDAGDPCAKWEGGCLSYRVSLEEEGVRLHPNEYRAAEQLLTRWGVALADPRMLRRYPGPFLPKDGILFLAALATAYATSSTTRSEPYHRA